MTEFFYKHENDLLNHFISSLDYKIVSRHDNECNATSIFVTPWRMFRLNSGIKNRYIFLFIQFFLFSIIGTDSVNHAESGDTKSLI